MNTSFCSVTLRLQPSVVPVSHFAAPDGHTGGPPAPHTPRYYCWHLSHEQKMAHPHRYSCVLLSVPVHPQWRDISLSLRRQRMGSLACWCCRDRDHPLPRWYLSIRHFSDRASGLVPTHSPIHPRAFRHSREFQHLPHPSPQPAQRCCLSRVRK